MRALTVKERIQLHLFDYSRFADSYQAPPDVTQQAIARAVGIRVHHVNQYVQSSFDPADYSRLIRPWEAEPRHAR